MLTVIQVSWQGLARPRDGLPKAVLRTELLLEAASYPFRYYYTTKLLKVACSAVWSLFLNVLAKRYREPEWIAKI